MHPFRYAVTFICHSEISCQEIAAVIQVTQLVQVRQANDVAEYRAAAYLRAASFYKYAADRSQYAARVCRRAVAPVDHIIMSLTLQKPMLVLRYTNCIQTHQRMKADAEWAIIEAKVAGTDADFKVCCEKMVQLLIEICNTSHTLQPSDKCTLHAC